MERTSPELKGKGGMAPSGFDPRMDAEKAGQIGRFKSFYRGKKVLVPGGAGFIGGRISCRLASLGAEVTIVDSLDKYCGGNLFNLHSCLEKIHLVRKKIEVHLQESSLQDFSCIFNCVGLSDHHLGLLHPDIDYRINCHPGVALLQKLAQNRMPTRIVSLGSRSQYGKIIGGTTETAPLKPLDIQAVHKTALEHYHRIFGTRFGVDFVFFRLTNTFGPAQRIRGEGIGFVGEIIRNGLDNQEVVIYGSLDRVKDLVYVEDVVDGLLYAGMIQEKSNSVFNLGGKPCRVGELLDCVRKEIPGIRVKVLPFPEHIKNMDTGDGSLSSEKFYAETGWVPQTILINGISSTIEYYRSHRPHYW